MTYSRQELKEIVAKVHAIPEWEHRIKAAAERIAEELRQEHCDGVLDYAELLAKRLEDRPTNFIVAETSSGSEVLLEDVAEALGAYQDTIGDEEWWVFPDDSVIVIDVPGNTWRVYDYWPN